MDALRGINERTSAGKLGEPAPTRDQIAAIIAAGAHAPDHGRLAPWRFVVLQGPARTRLGDAMAELKRRKKPEAAADELDKERAKALRAPVIIAVAARPVAGKIPEIEQIIAVGAGVENMFLAANALGFGAMWKTGDAAYDEHVKRVLGLERDDHIVAFLYLGTEIVPGQARALGAEALTSWL